MSLQPQSNYNESNFIKHCNNYDCKEVEEIYKNTEISKECLEKCFNLIFEKGHFNLAIWFLSLENERSDLEFNYAYCFRRAWDNNFFAMARWLYEKRPQLKLSLRN